MPELTFSSHIINLLGDSIRTPSACHWYGGVPNYTSLRSLVYFPNTFDQAINMVFHHPHLTSIHLTIPVVPMTQLYQVTQKDEKHPCALKERSPFHCWTVAVRLKVGVQKEKEWLQGVLECFYRMAPFLYPPHRPSLTAYLYADTIRKWRILVPFKKKAS